MDEENPIPVHNRLIEQLSQIVEQYFSNLIMVTTCSVQFSPSLEWRFFSLDRVRKTLSESATLQVNGIEVCRVSHRDLHPEFGMWISMHVPRTWYDLFISYRWGDKLDSGVYDKDSELVKGVFDYLTRYTLEENRPIHTFLDVHRLKDGQDLRDSFSVALMRSSLVVPIVSLNAINKIKRVPTCVDNVLVEWLLVAILFSPGMAELNPEMRVKRVLPVIIDKNLLDTIRNLPDLDIHPSALMKWCVGLFEIVSSLCLQPYGTDFHTR